MKNLSRKFTAVVLTLFILGGTAWAETRVATVDLRKLFEGYWKTKQAQAALKDRAVDFSKESNTLKESLRKGGEDYKKLLADSNDQAVSAEERDKRKLAAEAKLKELKETQDNLGVFERQAQTNLGEQNRRMRENILGEIRTVINGKAKSAGYTMVIDSTAETPNATLVVIYNSGENDLTDSVLAQLNANAPLDSLKTTDKPASTVVPTEKKDEKK